MLTSELVSQIRRAISDEVGTPRHPNSEIFQELGRTYAELYSLHPEAFIVDDYVLEAPEAPTTLTQEIVVSRYWTSAIVHNVAHAILSQDSENENNRALANDHYAKWKELV